MPKQLPDAKADPERMENATAVCREGGPDGWKLTPEEEARSEPNHTRFVHADTHTHNLLTPYTVSVAAALAATGWMKQPTQLRRRAEGEFACTGLSAFGNSTPGGESNKRGWTR